MSAKWKTAKEARKARREPLQVAYNLHPKDRPWLGSVARESARAEGERIRREQKCT